MGQISNARPYTNNVQTPYGSYTSSLLQGGPDPSISKAFTYAPSTYSNNSNAQLGVGMRPDLNFSNTEKFNMQGVGLNPSGQYTTTLLNPIAGLNMQTSWDTGMQPIQKGILNSQVLKQNPSYIQGILNSLNQATNQWNTAWQNDPYQNLSLAQQMWASTPVNSLSDQQIQELFGVDAGSVANIKNSLGGSTYSQIAGTGNDSNGTGTGGTQTTTSASTLNTNIPYGQNAVDTSGNVLTPAQVAQLQSTGSYTPTSTGETPTSDGSPVGVAMTVADPQGALSKYFNTAGYQLLFGGTPESMDTTLTPAERYQQSPGFQYLLNQSIDTINKNAAAAGLLGSGAAQGQLADKITGLLNQDYQNYINMLNTNYTGYQNALSGVANTGLQANGAQNAFNLGTNIGNLDLATANAIASLLSNQGTTGLGAYLNTGAGMSSNTMQAAAIQAQIKAAEAAMQQQQMAGLMQLGGSLLGKFF